MSSRSIHKNNTSGYRGVHLHSELQKWVARISINGKRTHLGVFDTAEEANLVKIKVEHERASERVIKPRSAAHRKALSEARKRDGLNMQRWLNMNHARKGTSLSIEHRKKIGAAGVGRIKSPETRAKISAVHKGKTVSNESRLKMSIAKKGQPHPKGADSHAWRGGLTPIRKMIRQSEKYKAWRKEIFERDNYTCQDCGARNSRGNPVIYLQADHIEPFAVIRDKYNIKTLEDTLNCTELWDVSNGQALCEKCHRDKTRKDMKMMRQTTNIWVSVT